MKVGDLVKMKWASWSSPKVGIIVRGPIDKVMLSGPSIQTMYLVSWQDGYKEWVKKDGITIYRGEK